MLGLRCLLCTLPGQKECTPCEPGMVAPAKGMAKCVRRDQGSYQTAPGMAACTLCTAPKTTPFRGSQFAEECVCPRAMYTNPGRKCVDCGTGMICEGFGLKFPQQGAGLASHSWELFIINKFIVGMQSARIWGSDRSRFKVCSSTHIGNLVFLTWGMTHYSSNVFFLKKQTPATGYIGATTLDMPVSSC